MRDKNQVVLPLDLGICIPEGDFVFEVAEIIHSQLEKGKSHHNV